MQPPEEGREPGLGEELCAEDHDDDAVLEDGLERLLVGEGGSPQRHLGLVVALEGVGFAEARLGHHIKGEGPRVVCDCLDGLLRAPVPTHCGGLDDAFPPDNLKVLVDEAGGHELPHLLPVRALRLRQSLSAITLTW